MAIVPRGSRWALGSSDKRPCNLGVGSPSLSAANPWANSWTVMEMTRLPNNIRKGRKPTEKRIEIIYRVSFKRRSNSNNSFVFYELAWYSIAVVYYNENQQSPQWHIHAITAERGFRSVAISGITGESRAAAGSEKPRKPRGCGYRTCIPCG